LRSNFEGGQADKKGTIAGDTISHKIEKGTTQIRFQKKVAKEPRYSIYLTTMKKPLNSLGGGKGKKQTHSSKRWQKTKKAIDKASDSGRLWWIEQYLRKTL
tara:strand:+ start:199 stop:501 length:303 start_codon:yes stop_codon:yes gene_type:complete